MAFYLFVQLLERFGGRGTKMLKINILKAFWDYLVANRFARPEPFVSDEKKEADGSAEAFHFVAYIEKNGAVYELDGLKGGPIRIGPVEEGTNWISSVATHALFLLKSHH